jgi:hypothetical protein
MLEAELEAERARPESRAARLRMPAEDLAWLGLPAAALALAAAFLLIAPLLERLHPEPARNVFAVWRVLIAPEPREEARSVLALGAPFALALVIAAAGTPMARRERWDLPVIALQVIGFVLIAVAVLGQTRSGPLLAPDYFEPLMIGLPNLVAGTCIGVLLTVLILRLPELRAPRALLRTMGWLGARGWIAIAIAVAATVLWLLPAVVTDETLRGSGQIASGHIPVQAEDYFAVINGRTPLVDYIALYTNLLPLVLAPLLAAFDSSITSFSLTMCALSTIAMLAVYGTFTQVTRRAWIALALFIPWVALSLIPWHQVGAVREFNGIYYGVMPARYLGPFLLAYLCALSTRRRVPTWALFGLAGIVVLNNAEFGIGALLGLIAATAVGADRAAPLRRSAKQLLLEGAGGLLGALALVCAVTLARTGELPDPSLLTYWDRLFLNSSYGLQRMPTLGLHWALYATYAAALLIAAVRYARADPDRTLTVMLAWAGTFGLATGMYFAGRSSQYQLMLLFPAWGFALALVAWAAARSLLSARGEPRRLNRLVVPACAALIGYGVMVAAIDRFPPPWKQIDRLSEGGQELSLEPAERYVASHTSPGERVLIIGTGLDHRVAERAGVTNVSPLDGVITLVSPAEADLALDQLDDSGGSQVFEAVSGLDPGKLVFRVPELAGILRERGYRLVAEDPTLRMRLWRRAPA